MSPFDPNIIVDKMKSSNSNNSGRSDKRENEPRMAFCFSVVVKLRNSRTLDDDDDDDDSR